MKFVLKRIGAYLIDIILVSLVATLISSNNYINKDYEDFMNNYQLWYDIVRKAKFMNTYWRNDRILNKSEIFELW